MDYRETRARQSAALMAALGKKGYAIFFRRTSEMSIPTKVRLMSRSTNKAAYRPFYPIDVNCFARILRSLILFAPTLEDTR